MLGSLDRLRLLNLNVLQHLGQLSLALAKLLTDPRCGRRKPGPSVRGGMSGRAHASDRGSQRFKRTAFLFHLGDGLGLLRVRLLMQLVVLRSKPPRARPVSPFGIPNILAATSPCLGQLVAQVLELRSGRNDLAVQLRALLPYELQLLLGQLRQICEPARFAPVRPLHSLPIARAASPYFQADGWPP